MEEEFTFSEEVIDKETLERAQDKGEDSIRIYILKK
jgi:hypothetical protein